MDIGSGHDRSIGEILQKWWCLEAVQTDDAIQECIFYRGNESPTTKKVIGLRRGFERAEILASLRALDGVRVMSGQAPPGFLEEEQLGTWLGILTTL